MAHNFGWGERIWRIPLDLSWFTCPGPLDGSVRVTGSHHVLSCCRCSLNFHLDQVTCVTRLTVTAGASHRSPCWSDGSTPAPGNENSNSFFPLFISLWDFYLLKYNPVPLFLFLSQTYTEVCEDCSWYLANYNTVRPVMLLNGD